MFNNLILLEILKYILKFFQMGKIICRLCDNVYLKKNTVQKIKIHVWINLLQIKLCRNRVWISTCSHLTFPTVLLYEENSFLASF